MTGEESITHWIEGIKAGNRDAADELWRRYFDRLVRLAQQRLRHNRPSVVDGEDVALSAFDSFCRAAAMGRFPNLADRDSLWRLIVEITLRKVVSQHRHETRLRRGGGREKNETALRPADQDQTNFLANIVGSEPTPEFAAVMAEEVNRLLERLGDPQLQKLVIGKMEGYSNSDMATQLNCSLRTIERRLRLVRQMYLEERSDGTDA